MLAVWFATLMVDPGAFPGCPMHGGVRSPAGATHAHAAHGAPADHGRGRHQCACPELCCAAPVVWRASGPVEAAASIGLALASHPAPPPSHSGRSPDHLRPFATAPPPPVTL